MKRPQTTPINQVAEIELVYKSQLKPSQMPRITSSKEAYEILLASWNPYKIDLLEECKVLLLNRNNKVLGICEISVGGISGTIVDVKLVFAAALKAAASGFIIAHNHPSGNLKASQEDIKQTRNLKMAGEILELPLVDHIILTSEGFVSLVDEGLI